MKLSKTDKLTNALKAGQRLTASQIKKKFGVSNPRATISNIRAKGFAVYANKRIAGNNLSVTEYRLGRPTKKVVAAGLRAVKN